jgi:hypothetical protein
LQYIFSAPILCFSLPMRDIFLRHLVLSLRLHKTDQFFSTYSCYLKFGSQTRLESIEDMSSMYLSL